MSQIESNTSFAYTVGGSLAPEAPSYVERRADKDLYAFLTAGGDCCYVFNSRQMGKSSLRVRTITKLQRDGMVCATLDPQTLGTQLDQSQWYASVIYSLAEELDLEGRCGFDLDTWWEEHDHLSPVKRLHDFIAQVVLTTIAQPIVIFIEEIDNLLNLSFAVDDFFALIRAFTENRAHDANFQRLSFVLVGVTTPRDLMRSPHHSAFNIGTPIAMAGFQLAETGPLMQGLAAAGFPQPRPLMAAVLHWTRGQPFLTQKLLSLLVREKATLPVAEAEQAVQEQWVAAVVQRFIIDNWQAQDTPEHLKTLQDRLLRSEERIQGSLLGLYQQVLDAKGGIPADESYGQLRLRLTGLVVKHRQRLQVYNPIYAAIFNRDWVQQQLAVLRPDFYQAALQSWQTTHEAGFLLRGEALRDAEAWAAGKQLSQDDQGFLENSRQEDRRLEREEKAILTRAKTNATRLSVGSIIIALAAALLAGWSGQRFLRANRKAEQAYTAQQTATQGANQANRKAEQAERDRRAAETQQGIATAKVKKLDKAVNQAKKLEQTARQRERQAQQQYRQASQQVQFAQRQLGQVNRDKAASEAARQRAIQAEQAALRQAEFAQAETQQAAAAAKNARRSAAAAEQARAAAQAAQRTILAVNRLEQEGEYALDQFTFAPVAAMVRSVRLGSAAQTLRQQGPLGFAAAPIYALHRNLADNTRGMDGGERNSSSTVIQSGPISR